MKPANIPSRIRLRAVAPIAGAIALLSVSGSAAAALTVRVTDGLNTLDCVDGALCDVNSSVGVVNFNTSLGGFLLSANLALSKPFLGTDQLPVLHLNTVNVSSAFQGTGQHRLTVLMSDTDFNGPATPVSYSLLSGGTTQGSASISAFVDSGNSIFGTTTPIGTQGPFGSGAFSGTDQFLLSPPAPYSITLGATIVHDAGIRVTSLDAELSPTPVPLPAGLLLLGSGLMGLLGFARRPAARVLGLPAQVSGASMLSRLTGYVRIPCLFSSRPSPAQR
jgi:hypothetical protein